MPGGRRARPPARSSSCSKYQSPGAQLAAGNLITGAGCWDAASPVSPDTPDTPAHTAPHRCKGVNKFRCFKKGEGAFSVIITAKCCVPASVWTLVWSHTPALPVLTPATSHDLLSLPLNPLTSLSQKTSLLKEHNLLTLCRFSGLSFFLPQSPSLLPPVCSYISTF